MENSIRHSKVQHTGLLYFLILFLKSTWGREWGQALAQGAHIPNKVYGICSLLILQFLETPSLYPQSEHAQSSVLTPQDSSFISAETLGLLEQLCVFPVLTLSWNGEAGDEWSRSHRKEIWRTDTAMFTYRAQRKNLTFGCVPYMAAWGGANFHYQSLLQLQVTITDKAKSQNGMEFLHTPHFVEYWKISVYF